MRNNLYEIKAKREMESMGWMVLQNGFPDFFCFRKTKNGDYQYKFVEVKSPKDKLTPSQKIVHKVFCDLGIPVEIKRFDKMVFLEGTAKLKAKPLRDKSILELRVKRNMSLSQLSEIFGLTRERIRQIILKEIEKSKVGNKVKK